MSCITQYKCNTCGWSIVCDSIKAGSIIEQEKIMYVYGPCVCITARFGPCGHCGAERNLVRPLFDSNAIFMLGDDWETGPPSTAPLIPYLTNTVYTFTR